MNKKLPNVYVVPIRKNFTNNKEVFKSSDVKEITESKSSANIDTKIREIFHEGSHVYKSKVKVVTKSEEKIVDMVGMMNNKLITLNGEMIDISSIVDIKKV